MKKLILSLSVIVFLISCNNTNKTEDKIHALLITGGHAFDTIAFFETFNAMDAVVFNTLSQPEANEHLVNENLSDIDVFVFYDLWENISEEQKNAYYAFAEEGKGFVFLHHSIVSYQGWDDFKLFVGGKYNENPSDSLKKSNYAHDLDMDVKVLDPNHPVLSGIKDFTIHDEGYSNIEISPEVHPLLGTDHPQAAKYVAWTNNFRNSRIVYILLGHDNKAWSNKNFSRLVENAIKWTSGEGED